MNKNKYNNKKMISELGFGAWTLGNTSRGKKMSFDDGVLLVRRAFHEGITFFDTSPNYALGESEKILGEALKDYREEVTINSKFGHDEFGHINFSSDEIIPSIKRSLKRLKTDYLDSVLLHNPSMDILKGETEHFVQLKKAKEQGLIRAFGVSIDSREELLAVLKYSELDVIELLFNIFFQENRDLLENVNAKGISLIIKVPLDSGWLTGTYHQNIAFTGVKSRWTKENLIRREYLVDKVRDIVGENHLTKYAIGYILSYDAVTTVIPGIRTITQLEDHLTAVQYQMPLEEKKQLETFYDLNIKNNPLSW
jgi:aryl-alcohol dehydrogenase-like predicted oxidoreductase